MYVYAIICVRIYAIICIYYVIINVYKKNDNDDNIDDHTMNK